MMYFLIIHALLCASVIFLHINKKINVEEHMFPIVLLVPFVGFSIIMVQVFTGAKEKLQIEEDDVSRFKIEDVRYKKISLPDNKNVEQTIPLEEAIILNDSKIKRTLMMDVLRNKPDNYVDILEMASLSDDTEISHYATTSMTLVQEDFEKKISLLEKKIEENSNNTQFLENYMLSLRKYLESGFLSGQILTIYQKKMQNVLDKLVKINPDSKEYLLEFIKTKIATRDYEGCLEMIKSAENKWGDDESVYRIYIEYAAARHDSKLIKEILDMIEQRNVYLSSNGKEWYRFWEGMVYEI